MSSVSENSETFLVPSVARPFLYWKWVLRREATSHVRPYYILYEIYLFLFGFLVPFEALRGGRAHHQVAQHHLAFLIYQLRFNFIGERIVAFISRGRLTKHMLDMCPPLNAPLKIYKI